MGEESVQVAEEVVHHQGVGIPVVGIAKVQNENAMILFVLDKTLNYVAFVNSTEICL